MARYGDLIGLIRGLELITKSAAASQGREFQRRFVNSSLKSSLQAPGKVVEDIVKARTPGVETIENVASAVNTVLDVVQKQINHIVHTVYSPTNTAHHSQPPQSSHGDHLDIANLKDFVHPAYGTGVSFSGDDDNVLGSTVGTSTSAAAHTAAAHTAAPQTAAAQTAATHTAAAHTVAAQTAATHSAARNAPSSAFSQPKRDFHWTARCFVITPVTTTATPDAPVAKERIRLKTGNVGQHLSSRARERRVPATRVGRMVSFGGLAAGLSVGALGALVRHTLGQEALTAESNPFLTEANAERIVNTLCRVRGAALKLGQMLSIQDNTMLSPQLQQMFERVRQSADFMPVSQMEKALHHELGPGWREKLDTFDEKPFAAASIGQVHRATLPDGRQVAIKIQYPGVADSINSDIDNLLAIMKMSKILPEAMYVENAMNVARRELAWEVDYLREAQCATKFRELLKDDPVFIVPEVIKELSSRRVLTSEFVEGVPLDQCVHLEQDTKNQIGQSMLRLTMEELFVHRYMQTDPNWSNFFFNEDTGKLTLLDFGATRTFDKRFVDDYIRVIKAAADQDKEKVLEYSIKLGFLTGFESKVMEQAHVSAVTILGSPFTTPGVYDFGHQDITHQVISLIPVLLKHRLRAPPDESYSLHRKMSGAFLICAKLKAQLQCKPMFDKIWREYNFGTT